MGDRLARFGFTVSQGGRQRTVTPSNVDLFIKEQISRSFAFKDAKSSIKSVDVPKPAGLAGFGIQSGAADPIFAQSDVKRVGLNFDPTSKAVFEATQKQLSTAFSAQLKTRGITDTGLGNVQSPIGAVRQVKATQLAGAEEFNQQFFGQVFGTGNRILGTDTIHELFNSEKEALSQVDFLFSKGGNALRNEVFSFTQDVANVHQKIRDSKISGGPLGGVLKVATFGLSVSGLGNTLLSKAGLGPSGPGVVSQGLKKLGVDIGGLAGAVKTTAGTIGASAANSALTSLAKKFSQRPPGERVGVQQGVQSGADKIANAQRAENAPKTASKRPSILPAILSRRSVDRINMQREALGKQNLTGRDGSKPNRRRRVLTRGAA